MHVVRCKQKEENFFFVTPYRRESDGGGGGGKGPNQKRHFRGAGDRIGKNCSRSKLSHVLCNIVSHDLVRKIIFSLPVRNCTIFAQACVEDLIFLLKWLMLIFNFCVSTISIVERVINKTKSSFMQICVYLISFVRGMQDVYQHELEGWATYLSWLGARRGALKIFLEHSLDIAYFSMEGSLINVHLSRSLIRFADRPVKDRKRSKSFCVGLPRTLCAYIFIRFERIIHSIWADFAPQKPLSGRLYTMPCVLSQNVAHAC